MIKKGLLVKRIENDRLRHIEHNVLLTQYPPAGSLCIVVSSPKEKDLSEQAAFRRMYTHAINLKKAIDVMSENKLYKDCEVTAFIKVK
jgi:hypothetical protein